VAACRMRGPCSSQSFFRDAIASEKHVRGIELEQRLQYLSFSGGAWRGEHQAAAVQVARARGCRPLETGTLRLCWKIDPHLSPRVYLTDAG